MSSSTTASLSPDGAALSGVPDAGRETTVERAFRGRMPALDGVRGLAVLMVLLLHFVGAMEPTNWLERRINWVTSYGAFGVELFFVLSGFLITGILQDSRAKAHYFRNFYMRRLLRIFPLYYGVLAALFFVAPLVPLLRGPDLEFLRQHQAWAWLYGVNVYIAIHGEWALSYIDHFWSLCVEEHFYFVWPLLVWVVGSNPRRLMWTSLVISVTAMAARTIGNVAGLPWWTTYVLTPFRLDGLALGGFLAMLTRMPGGPAAIHRNLGRAAAVVAALAASTFAWVLISQRGLSFLYPVRASLITMLLAVLLLAALLAPDGSPLKRFFCSPAMTFLGTYSYGIYVYHHFISYYLMTHRTEFVVAGWIGSHLGAVLLQATAGIAASVAIAYLSYEFFEKRFLGLKRFFEARS
jgi:peptidoglycan/LPS O-acetylase OafA/YrhL